MSETSTTGFVVLGNQLFPLRYFSEHKANLFFMAEDKGLCTHFRYHKQKLTFFLASMRHFGQELANNHYQLYYYALEQSDIDDDPRYEEKLEDFISEHRIEKLKMFEPEDAFFEKRLRDFCQKKGIDLTLLSSPLFLFDRKDFEEEAQRSRGPFMKSYYEQRRKREKVLMNTDGSPVGGKFSFDADNRKKLPDSVAIPKLAPLKHHDEITLSVQSLVSNCFAEHPGENAECWLPLTHKQANHWLKSFLEERLDQFGPYEDALSSRDPFLFHSVLSPMMNNGLLPARDVLDSILTYYDQHPKTSLSSVEGLVRQIMGWREFMRGIYHRFGERQYKTNFFCHERKLTHHWYEGTTGLPHLDEAIQKAQKWGYTHHIERLMVLGNCMLLCEIHPHEAYKWFMEMYIDSSDWVMVPNVFGMGIFSDGGIFATKPYCAGSNYIRKMGHYPKGEWQDVMDGLYWRFIEKNKTYFDKNPRTPFMVKTLNKMANDKKERIFKAAEQFLQSKTN